MRNNRQDARDSRARVVRKASALFRERGYDGVGIATLMKAAGLTNGAFYKQFDSKEALIAEATAHALSENSAAWDKVLEHAGDDPLAAISQWYLSDTHLGNRRDGCAYAALAADAPRHDPAVREAFDGALDRTLGKIEEALDPSHASETRAKAARALCQLVGALTLARAVSDPALAESLLAACREQE